MPARGDGMRLREDGTSECPDCGLPMFPVDEAAYVRVECANRHAAKLAVPADPAMRRLVHRWVARRGAQLHAQHERWEADDE